MHDTLPVIPFLRGVRGPVASNDAAKAAQWRAELLRERNSRRGSAPESGRGAIEGAYRSALAMAAYEASAASWPSPASVMDWLLGVDGGSEDE